MRPRGPGKKTPSNKSAEERLNWFEFYLGRKNRWSSNTLGGGASLCAARPLHVAALGAHLPPHGRTSSQTSSNVMKPPLLCQSGKNTFVFSALAAGAQNDRAPSVRRCGRRNNERKAKNEEANEQRSNRTKVLFIGHRENVHSFGTLSFVATSVFALGQRPQFDRPKYTRAHEHTWHTSGHKGTAVNKHRNSSSCLAVQFRFQRVGGERLNKQQRLRPAGHRPPRSTADVRLKFNKSRGQLKGGCPGSGATSDTPTRPVEMRAQDCGVGPEQPPPDDVPACDRQRL